MTKKMLTVFMMMTALFCFSNTSMAMSYDEAYETISAQFNSSSSSLGNYDSLKAQLPDVSGNFNIMSQSDIDNVMNSYSAEIQGKYQSSISTAQANAQSSSAEAMANISARAKSIQNGIDPDTGESYSTYLSSHTPSYDADAWLASATANLSSNISTLQGIVGEAEMPENKLMDGAVSGYKETLSNYNDLVSAYEASKTSVINAETIDTFMDVTFDYDNIDDQERKDEVKNNTMRLHSNSITDWDSVLTDKGWKVMEEACNTAFSDAWTVGDDLWDNTFDSLVGTDAFEGCLK